MAYQPKVVSSFIITSEIYPTEQEIPLNLKVWHYNGSATTVNFSQIKNLYFSSNPYYTNSEGNTSSQGVHVNYTIYNPGKVRISILPARFPWESSLEVMQRIGAASFKVRDGGKVIVDNQMMNQGSHEIIFDPYSYKLPTGVYIMQLETKYMVQERALFIVNRCKELHPQLLKHTYCRDD